MKRSAVVTVAALVVTAGCGGGEDDASVTQPPVTAVDGSMRATSGPSPIGTDSPPASSEAPTSTVDTTSPSSDTTVAPTTPAVPTSTEAVAPVVDEIVLETALVGLSIFEQQHPVDDGAPVDLPSCELVDQAVVDDAYAAIGQPQPFAPLTATVVAQTSEVNGSPMRSFQAGCRAVAREGVVAPTSDLTIAVATKGSDVTMGDLIADSDPHTVTNESTDGPVLGAAQLGYCYDYDANSYCFQSFDYGSFAVILKAETPAGVYDPAALSSAAQAVVPDVLDHLAQLAGG